MFSLNKILRSILLAFLEWLTRMTSGGHVVAASRTKSFIFIQKVGVDRILTVKYMFSAEIANYDISIRDYSSSDIFNADETGLFSNVAFKIQPLKRKK